MKNVELEYTVVELGMMGALIEMKLKAPMVIPDISLMEISDNVPSEEDVKRMLSKFKPVESRSDEGIVANKFVNAYIDAIKEKMPSFFEELEDRHQDRGGWVASPMAPLYDAVLYLSRDQYEAMGNPPLLSKLRFNVGMIK